MTNCGWPAAKRREVSDAGTGLSYRKQDVFQPDEEGLHWTECPGATMFGYTGTNHKPALPLMLHLHRRAGRAKFLRSHVCFFRLLAAVLLVAGLTQSQLWSQNLIISEFMAANNSGARDVDGDFSDWIEIYNPERAPASLAGW
jgi:hypothetical protein